MLAHIAVVQDMLLDLLFVIFIHHMLCKITVAYGKRSKILQDIVDLLSHVSGKISHALTIQFLKCKLKTFLLLTKTFNLK